MGSSSIPDPIPHWQLTLTPQLKDDLLHRSNRTLLDILKANKSTTFCHEATSLSGFHNIVAGAFDMSDSTLLELFKSNVPLTDYEDYRPFVDRFFVQGPESCQAKAVTDLLAPGLPLFLAKTSGTSGSLSKNFPKYDHPIYRNALPGSVIGNELMTCSLTTLRVTETIELRGTDGVCRALPIASITVGGTMIRLGISVGREMEFSRIKYCSDVSPLGVCFLSSEKSVMIMHMFFALSERRLEVLTAQFSTRLWDAIRMLQDHWEVMVAGIEYGSTPPIACLGEYREAIEEHIQPQPERARALRQIEVGSFGWLREVWPNLTFVLTNGSGIYALPIVKLREALGPEVTISSRYWGSTECSIASTYTSQDLNLYKMTTYEYFEFLDITKDATVENLTTYTGLEVGKKYELVATTRDGLWRYRHGDVAEIAGFCPKDGQPLLRFVERRGIKFRIAGEFLSEKYLADCILCIQDAAGLVLEFMAYLDTRKAVRCYGYFVELDGQQGDINGPSIIAQLNERLMCDAEYKYWFEQGRIGPPTIRFVSSSSFQDFREWRSTTNSIALAQVKIPIATIEQTLVRWMENRVVAEVE